MITTEWRYPSVLTSTTQALQQEVVRIRDHKADVIFTLINDTKLADWKNTLPECDKWVQAKSETIRVKQATYATGQTKIPR
jgi:hypothetical protein